MKIAVRYYSRTGNTKKLAEAIAKAVHAEAKSTDEPLCEDVDILFLGSSVYANGVDGNIKAFIRGINVKVGEVINFSTAALVKSTCKQVGKLLAESISRCHRKNFIAEDHLQCCIEDGQMRMI